MGNQERDRPASEDTNATLTERVYAQLRAIAQKQMNEERTGHTLQATALVHEAYLRLASAGLPAAGPGAFYHAAAEAMRRILIEHARKPSSVVSQSESESVSPAGMPVGTPYEEYLAHSTIFPESVSRAATSERQFWQ